MTRGTLSGKITSMQSGLCYLSAGLKLTKLLRLEILPPIHEKTAAWKIIYVSCPSVWENGLDLLIQSRPPYTTINLLIISPTLTYYTGWYLIPGKKRASPSFYRPNLKTRLTKKFSRSFGLAYRKANDYEIYEIYDWGYQIHIGHTKFFILQQRK